MKLNIGEQFQNMILLCLTFKDSYENESYFVDENNEYTKPTSYDSPLDFGYNSFDEHVDEVKIDEYIGKVKLEKHGEKPVEKTDRNETFYESPKEMEKRKKLRREWVIPGFVNYSFQTIPTMISSLSDYALYKGAMFMS